MGEILRITTSICPECMEPIKAEIYIDESRGENGWVMMRKECDKHGKFEDKISIDPELYQWKYDVVPEDSWWDSSWTEHKVDAEYYTVMQLAGSFEIIRGFTAFGRIENLANKKYENPVGYKSPERSYYAGLKIVL